MKTKTNKIFIKTAVALMFVLFAVIFAGKNDAEAKTTDVVRVSTQKELNAAMKNADVGTIILRSQMYGRITIKRSKAAAEKFLIVDMPNALIENKAVFAEIGIISAGNYIESVSGNKIVTSSDAVRGTFFVNKGKKIKSLKIQSAYGDLDYSYILRKGAKIKEISYVYVGNDAPVESAYNKSKRTLTLAFTDSADCSRSYTVKYDKSGRVTRFTCDSNWVEYSCDYKFKYDSDGNITKRTGKDNESGKFTETVTYSDGKKQKDVFEGAYRSTLQIYFYDEDGKLIKVEITGKDQMDGEAFDIGYIDEYEYDNDGHQTYARWEDTETGNFIEYDYIYNKKEFLIKSIGNNSGSETIYTYEYNKAGDLLKASNTNEGTTLTTTYEYDDLGNFLKSYS
jgi:hypothetical protein